MPKNQEKRSAVPSPDPEKFQEAIDAFRRRDPITDDQLATLDAVERERAFWVAGVAEADVVQDVYDAIDSAISNGTTFEEFQAAVGTSLADAWGAEQPARLETVFRTNVMGAYNAGRHTMMTAPVVLEARPYWRCDRMHGGNHNHDEPDHVCKLMDGVVKPATDGLWDTHHPPFHHNCGCILTPLTKDEAGEEGISLGGKPSADPAEGFGQQPSVTGVDWTPDMTAYSPDIASELRAKLAL